MAIAGGIVAVALGGTVVYFVHTPAAPAGPAKPKDVVTYSTKKPSEAPVAKSDYVSTAAPNEPKYIIMPSIGAEGYVQKMGVDQNNQVAAPNNVNLAGWYVNSLAPGQAGLSIMDGHVDGLHGPGIFINLNKLQVGDTFTVELGSGVQKTFKVASVSSVAEAVAATTLFARVPSIASQLNLITCSGAFDQQAHAYQQRTIVVSELITG